jgi:hypothetical protein
LVSELVAHSSIPEGEPGWLPEPSTYGNDSLSSVLANLKYISSFAQTDVTREQISQLLWAGYGCTPHTTYNRRAGLTVPSAWANYYLTGTIYLADKSGLHRYHNRNPGSDLTSRDHRVELMSDHDALRSSVSGLPQAPCYILLCLDASSAAHPYAQLETGFVASNIFIQASAIDLGCHFRTGLTDDEKDNCRTATDIPPSHIPQAIVSIGSAASTTEVPVTVSVVLQGAERPDTGWVVPLVIQFFALGANVMADTALYEFNLTTAKSPAENVAVCEAESVPSGTYDVTAFSEHTLINVRRAVAISAPATSVHMGTLIEGDSDDDSIVTYRDLAVLSMSWLASEAQVKYDARADFDRNGVANMADLSLLAASWLRSSPVEISL